MVVHVRISMRNTCVVMKILLCIGVHYCSDVTLYTTGYSALETVPALHDKVPKMSQLIKVVVPRVTTVGKRLPTVWRLNQTLTKKQHPDEPEDSRIEVFDHWLSSNDGIQPKNLECTSLRPSKNIHSLQHQVRKLKKNWKNCLCKQNISSLYTE
ncbi:uncharacterized protein [Dysidea avara]|uniref:uncharacterized protein n=1 Tax=Dysidea avara TaxID=196820 RepID=UPI0033229555